MGWGSFINYLHRSVFSQMLCYQKTSVWENENKEQVRKATTFEGRWDKAPSSSGCSQLAAFCWGRVIICFTDLCLSISFNSHRRALLSDLSFSPQRRSWIPSSRRLKRLPQWSTSFVANGMQALLAKQLCLTSSSLLMSRNCGRAVVTQSLKFKHVHSGKHTHSRVWGHCWNRIYELMILKAL